MVTGGSFPASFFEGELNCDCFGSALDNVAAGLDAGVVEEGRGSLHFVAPEDLGVVQGAAG